MFQLGPLRVLGSVKLPHARVGMFRLAPPEWVNEMIFLAGESFIGIGVQGGDEDARYWLLIHSVRYDLRWLSADSGSVVGRTFPVLLLKLDQTPLNELQCTFLPLVLLPFFSLQPGSGVSTISVHRVYVSHKRNVVMALLWYDLT